MTDSPEIMLKIYQQALLHNPKDLDAQIICANLCVELQRFEEAAGYFRRIVHITKSDQARNALSYCLEMLGNLAQSQSRYLQAQACFEEALEYQPGNAIHWYNLGNAQRDLGEPKAALQSFKKSIQFDANDADTYNNLGNVQRELGLLDQAIASYEKALQINPNAHYTLAHWVHQKQHICDWLGLDTAIVQLRTWVKTESAAKIPPFAFLAMPNTSAAEQKQCANNFAHNSLAPAHTTFKYHKKPKSKLTIGYLSADFRLHPLAFLITEMIENHDKNQVKTIAYSYGLDDKTAEQKRLARTFDEFKDIRKLNDSEAANLIYADQVDILLDLTGYTQSSRTGIVALKPAPISINWLGYPGTMGEVQDGKPLFDYILADSIIAPNPADFSEQLLYLPCYQPNDSQRPVGKITKKSAQHLPEDAFVWCCFNQSFKITAEVFSIWMRILKQTPSSVLWLLDCNPWAKSNLQRSGALAGIDKNRLIFAPRVAINDHLARHVHADLFLDTLPYNAHTTASDALYMGLPVLTCMGDTFASRVAASLLLRVNMPELISYSLLEYEQKALDLANNPEKLAQLKQRLKLKIKQTSLFSPAQFVRDLERQYQRVWQATI